MQRVLCKLFGHKPQKGEPFTPVHWERGEGRRTIVYLYAKCARCAADFAVGRTFGIRSRSTDA